MKPMTLGQLVAQFGADEDVMLEVNHDSYKDWDDVDAIWCKSPILKPYYNHKIKRLTAISLDTFRFTLTNEAYLED